LYLEADTPAQILQSRLDFLPEPVGEWMLEFLNGHSLDLLRPDNIVHGKLRNAQSEYNPELVVWNTMRQFYQASNIDSETVPRVYAAMYRAFPSAGHVVVTHDRKVSQHDDNLNEHEAFSGSNAWRDLATISLHLKAKREKNRSLTLTVYHTKSQASELVDPLQVHLAPNGTHLTAQSAYAAKIDRLWAEAPPGDRAAWVAKELGVSRKTVFRHKGDTAGEIPEIIGKEEE
jgi:hypothetical protein